MKKVFETPIIVVVVFDDKDIITTSAILGEREGFFDIGSYTNNIGN